MNSKAILVNFIVFLTFFILIALFDGMEGFELADAFFSENIPFKQNFVGLIIQTTATLSGFIFAGFSILFSTRNSTLGKYLIVQGEYSKHVRSLFTSMSLFLMVLGFSILVLFLQRNSYLPLLVFFTIYAVIYFVFRLYKLSVVLLNSIEQDKEEYETSLMRKRTENQIKSQNNNTVS